MTISALRGASKLLAKTASIDLNLRTSHLAGLTTKVPNVDQNSAGHCEHDQIQEHRVADPSASHRHGPPGMILTREVAAAAAAFQCRRAIFRPPAFLLTLRAGWPVMILRDGFRREAILTRDMSIGSMPPRRSAASATSDRADHRLDARPALNRQVPRPDQNDQHAPERPPSNLVKIGLVDGSLAFVLKAWLSRRTA